MPRAGVADPNVGVPSSAFWVHHAVRADDAGFFQLRQHDDDPTTLHHTKRRRLVPETLIVKSELVAIVIRRRNHVIHDEVRPMLQRGLNSSFIRHQFLPTECQRLSGGVYLAKCSFKRFARSSGKTSS